MARRGSAAVAIALAAVLSGGCTTNESTPSGPHDPEDAALRVTTLSGSGLDQATRARLESEVSDVLAEYVAAGFLGDYPRSDFVQAFADFTSGAAEQAVGDIDVLTASGFPQIRSVTATDLSAELSFLVAGEEPIGVNAWVDFSFDVKEDDSATEATLSGRLTLEHRDGQWSVFGYDVRRSDGDALPTEASSS